MAKRMIGVIGLGQMGRGIATNLDRSGYLTAAWDIRPEAFAATRLSVDVANISPAAMAERCEAVIFVVPASQDVEKCLAGKDGLLTIRHDNQAILDFTTSNPLDTLRLVEMAADAGRDYLDAGMSGGAMGADSGKLTLMVGGFHGVLGLWRPMLETIAAKIIYVGKPGAGHTVKLIHNMILHSIFFATSEGCRMAERLGIDLATAIEVLNAGNARSYVSEVRFPRHILSGSFNGGSYVSTLAKDLGMAVDLAKKINMPTPYGSTTSMLLNEALARGHGRDDFTRLYEIMDRLLGQYAAQHPAEIKA